MSRNSTYLVLLLSLSLGACAESSMNDLQQFVENAHKDKKPRVEPIPEVKTQEQFAYASSDGVDPFAVFNLRPRGATKTKAGGPSLSRRREPLEEYPLDALKMVGTLQRNKQAWAVIQAPDRTVHRVRIGNFLGQNFGKITRITEGKVILVETIQDPLGDWIKRDASLSIEE